MEDIDRTFSHRKLSQDALRFVEPVAHVYSAAYSISPDRNVPKSHWLGSLSCDLSFAALTVVFVRPLDKNDEQPAIIESLAGLLAGRNMNPVLAPKFNNASRKGDHSTLIAWLPHREVDQLRTLVLDLERAKENLDRQRALTGYRIDRDFGKRPDQGSSPAP